MVDRSRQRSLVLAIFMGLFPLLSVLLCLDLLLPFAEQNTVAQSAQPVTQREIPGQPLGGGSSSENIGWLPLVPIFLALLAKLAAIVGNVRRWYYGWVFHSIEIHLVIFIHVLLIVISVFSLPLTLVGLFKFLLLFMLLITNFQLQSYWSGRKVRDLYRVGHYIRMDKV